MSVAAVPYSADLVAGSFALTRWVKDAAG